MTVSDRRPGITKLVLILWFLFLYSWKLSVIRCFTHFSVWLRTGSNPPDLIGCEAILENEYLMFIENFWVPFLDVLAQVCQGEDGEDKVGHDHQTCHKYPGRQEQVGSPYNYRVMLKRNHVLVKEWGYIGLLITLVPKLL